MTLTRIQTMLAVIDAIFNRHQSIAAMLDRLREVYPPEIDVVAELDKAIAFYYHGRGTEPQ